jgi:hypothetical protein
MMPTKERRARDALRTAEQQRQHEQFANMPAHIKKRANARKAGIKIGCNILADILNSDPAYLKLKGGLLVVEPDGSVGILAKGDPTGSANDVRADASQQDLKALQERYPDDWLKRGGAKRIALTEGALPPQERAIKPRIGHPAPISERTVQDYFRKIRRATRVP